MSFRVAVFPHPKVRDDKRDYQGCQLCQKNDTRPVLQPPMDIEEISGQSGGGAAQELVGDLLKTYPLASVNSVLSCRVDTTWTKPLKKAQF